MLTAHKIFPMDEGSVTYTEFETDMGFAEFMSENFDTMIEEGWSKMGLVHSHNVMDVYFSITDTEELDENVGNHNFYLSLIVNNKGEKCAKVAYVERVSTKSTLSFSMKDDDGKWVDIDAAEDDDVIEQMVTIDCAIEVESIQPDPDDWFMERVDEIKMEAVKRRAYEAAEKAKKKQQYKKPYVYKPPVIGKTDDANDFFAGVEAYEFSQVSSFLKKLITCDPGNESLTINECLEFQHKNIDDYSGEERGQELQSLGLDMYDMYDACYYDVFGVNDSEEVEAKVIQDAINQLAIWAERFPEVSKVTQAALLMAGQYLKINGIVPAYEPIEFKSIK